MYVPVSPTHYPSLLIIISWQAVKGDVGEFLNTSARTVMEQASKVCMYVMYVCIRGMYGSGNGDSGACEAVSTKQSASDIFIYI